MDNVTQRLGSASVGPYPEPPDSALAFPIIPSGTDHPVAICIAGVSARLLMNDANPDFYDLVTSAVNSAVSDAWAHEEDKQRGNALADLDQTRTAFASDVIPEFCTPLSRTPGPVEDALAAPNEPLLSLQREQTKIIYGHVLRSPRQINNLGFPRFPGRFA